MRRWAGLLAVAMVAVACTADAQGGPAAEGAGGQAAVQRPPNEGWLFAGEGWKTDFSRAAVPLQQIISGGVRRDGIPPIDRPNFVDVPAAAAWLKDQEPVLAMTVRSDARAYPLQIMTWHEIVNDTVAGLPVAVTFCPLCNSGIAFERRVDGVTYDFGTTGKLFHSDLIMWDRQTESWWQQMTGEAIVGELTGKRLTMIPVQLLSWAQFRAAYPGGKVLSRETGHSRPYGTNPYEGYDDVNASPFLFRGRVDGRLPATERVVSVEAGGEAVAYPYPVLRERGVVHDTVGGAELVVLWAPGQASALDTSDIASGRDVGTVGVFSRRRGEWLLTFRQVAPGRFEDAETRSQWTVAGVAESGPLAGSTLTPVVHNSPFWFSWAAFQPATRVYGRDR